MRKTAAFLFAFCLSVHLSARPGNPPSPCKLTTDGDFEVTMVFTGILMFGMPEIANQPIVMIMPNEKKERKGLGADKRDVPAHVPYLLADKVTMSDANNPTITFKAAHNEPATYRYVELNGDQIVIDEQNAIPDVNTRLCYVTGGSGACPGKTTATSLRWIPSLGRTNAGTTYVKNTERFHPQPKPDHVAARMSLRYGALDAHVTDPRQWTFKVKADDPADQNIVQATAQEIHYRFRARGTELVLHLVGFDGKSYRRLVLSPKDGALKLVVGNAMREDIGPISGAVSASYDEHYLLYYAFAENDPHPTGRYPFEYGANLCTDEGMYDPALKPDPTHRAAAAPRPAPHTHSNSKDKPESWPSSSGLNCPPVQYP